MALCWTASIGLSGIDSDVEMEMMDLLAGAGSRLALGLTAGLMMTAGTAGFAKSADLDGDCCTDLEERVAALDATTVTHGDRELSMKVSGWVNAAVVWWGDGGNATDGRDPGSFDKNSDVYFVNNSTAQSRVDIEGVAKLRADLSAGYSIGLRPWGSKLSDASQIASSVNPSNVDIRDTYVFLDSKQFGKVQLGQQVSAADSAWYQDLGASSTWISNINPGAWNTSFYLRDVDANLANVTWGSVLQEMSDSQVPRIAYYSPQTQGFQAAASYGGDKTWALALYYARSMGTLSVSAGIGYDVSQGSSALADQLVGTGLVDQHNTHLAKLGMSGSLYESRSGLYGTLGYSAAYAAVAGRDNATNLYGKLGWRKNVSTLGETNIYGEYDRTTEAYGNGVSAHVWGAGVTQDIDSVDSILYVGYRHASLENSIVGANLVLTADQTATNSSPDAAAAIASQSFDAVMGGMVVQF